MITDPSLPAGTVDARIAVEWLQSLAVDAVIVRTEPMVVTDLSLTEDEVIDFVATLRRAAYRRGVEAVVAIIEGGHFLSMDSGESRWARSVVAKIRRDLAEVPDDDA